MITVEMITEANKKLQSIPLKGKDYVMVNQRIKAFREICPEGSITTEILSWENGVVVMKTTVTDENGRILGTGMAYEKESSNFINGTSLIENCETSAVGRALGMCGIGIEGSICSAEELVNAVTNQKKTTPKPPKQEKSKENPKPEQPEDDPMKIMKKAFSRRCSTHGQDAIAILKQAGWDGVGTVKDKDLIIKGNLILDEILEAQNG